MEANWPDRRLLDLLGIALPIIQAPMAGADSPALAKAVASTGAMGSLACALLDPAGVRAAMEALGACEGGCRFNLNFFCHTMDPPKPEAMERWRQFLRPHYEKLGLSIESVPAARLRLPFDEEVCAVVEYIRPAVVSFHFGLPAVALLERLRRKNIRILATATSVREAKWLAERGCDAIIAQGLEAGGHRGMFLETSIATQTGLFALLPRIVDAVQVPVIAAGGIADGRGIAAAFALGAAGVQVGTAYLRCPEAQISLLYREALAGEASGETALTNLFSGRPARGIYTEFLREGGPMQEAAPAFPYAATLVAPLRTASEKAGSTAYMQMWAGQTAGMSPALPAAEFTRALAADALRRMGREGATPL